MAVMRRSGNTELGRYFLFSVDAHHLAWHFVPTECGVSDCQAITGVCVAQNTFSYPQCVYVCVCVIFVAFCSIMCACMHACVCLCGRLYEGAAGNLPDEAAASAAQLIVDVAKRCEKGDLLVALISGGGSALLPSPAAGVTLDDKRHAIELVARAGGDIVQLNTLRKHLSSVKGGKLAAAAYPANVSSSLPPSYPSISHFLSLSVSVSLFPLHVITGITLTFSTYTPACCSTLRYT